MGVRLSRLPDYLRKWGVAHALVDGWQTRSRSSGDFVDVMAVGIHHTASKTTADRDQGWCITNSGDRPIGNGLLCRDGSFRLWGVRSSNTQGKGGPYLTSRGVIPLNSGNTRMFSIEAQNDGIGERWTDALVDAYPRLCAAVIDCVNETTPGARLGAGDVIAHHEWAPGRKFDPAGPSPWGPGLWRMNDFRGAVYALLNPPAPAPPPAPPTASEEVASMLERLIRLRGQQVVYATYSGGYKTWIPNLGHLHTLQRWMESAGLDPDPTDFDIGEFVAFGPILGPTPPGVDAWGLPVAA